MALTQALLVSTGLAILAIRVSGNCPELIIYMVLEVVVYCLLLIKLFWPTVHVSKEVKFPTHRITLPRSARNSYPPETTLSPIFSPDEMRSETSEDSLVSTIIRISDGTVTAVPPSVPLLKPVLVGFPKPKHSEVAGGKVSELSRGGTLPAAMKLTVPRTEMNFDAGKRSIREMDVFEAKAMKELTELTKKVEETVKHTKLTEEPTPPPLRYSPSIVDLPKQQSSEVKESDDKVATPHRTELMPVAPPPQQASQMVVEVPEPPSPLFPQTATFSASQQPSFPTNPQSSFAPALPPPQLSPNFALTRQSPVTGQPSQAADRRSSPFRSTNPFSATQASSFSEFNPVPSQSAAVAVDRLPSSFSQSSVSSFLPSAGRQQPENPFARVSNRDSMELEPPRSQCSVADTYAARLASEPSAFVPPTRLTPVPPARLTPVPPARLTPVPATSFIVPRAPQGDSEALRPLLEFVSEKERLVGLLDPAIKREIVRFCYGVSTDPLHNARVRNFMEKVSPAATTSKGVFLYLSERIIAQNVSLMREQHGIPHAEAVLQTVSVLSKEWKQLEEVFVHELLTAEPSLCSGVLADGRYTSELLRYAGRRGEDYEESLEKAYFYGVLFGLTAKRGGKVTLADVWGLISMYLNAKVDDSCRRVPPVLAGLLRVVGADLDTEYRQQFRKLTNLLLNSYFPEYSRLFPTDPSTLYIHELTHLTHSGKFENPLEVRRVVSV